MSSIAAVHEAPAGLPFSRLLRLEAEHAIRPAHLTMLVLLCLTGVLVAWWLPMWPQSIYEFFHAILHLDGWPEIVLSNNYTGFIFFLYWFGLIDVLRIYVLPLEGGYLDLLLSKPVPRSSYMLARIIPSFAVIVLVGIISAVVHAVAMMAFGLDLDVGAYAGTIAAILGGVLLLLAVANILLLFVRDSFAALLIGFAVFMTSFTPSIVYLYRPDAYEGAPFLADLLFFPINLLWHPDWATRLGPVIGLCGAATALILALAAGASLQRRDVG